jgi:pyruvate ferredoxin oxidoreductase gamma subunit
MTEIRWHGRGGQGAFTAAKILGAAALKEDIYALSFPSFGPERRGAPVLAFTKIDNIPIQNRSEIKKCDYIVFLDETLFSEESIGDLKENGKIILSTGNSSVYSKYREVIAIDALSMAEEIIHMPITNTAMLGALIGVSKILKLDSVFTAAEQYLNKRIVEKNIEIIQKSYLEVKGALK